MRICNERAVRRNGWHCRSNDIFADRPPRLRREWKTPPLWGVRDFAPYLHDGRAKTLVQAIAAHGGEAEKSAKKFAGLDFVQRSHLVMFLNSLAGPPSQSTAVDLAELAPTNERITSGQ